jgi:hypothetical protein
MSSPYTKKVLLPIYIPDSIIKLDVPLNLMCKAIYVFNEKNKEDPLSVSLGYGKYDWERMVIFQIFQRKNDLFLEVSVPSNIIDIKLRAHLVGYVVLDKSTGKVEDMVIEGFRFEKAKDIDFEDVPI